MTDYSEGFWITLTGLVIGFFGLSIRYCLKSKCNSVECFCFKIHRAVDLEEKFEEKQLDYGIYDKEETKTIK
jgi:hypothetical protein